MSDDKIKPPGVPGKRPARQTNPNWPPVENIKPAPVVPAPSEPKPAGKKRKR